MIVKIERRRGMHPDEAWALLEQELDTKAPGWRDRPHRREEGEDPETGRYWYRLSSSDICRMKVQVTCVLRQVLTGFDAGETSGDLVIETTGRVWFDGPAITAVRDGLVDVEVWRGQGNLMYAGSTRSVKIGEVVAVPEWTEETWAGVSA